MKDWLLLVTFGVISVVAWIWQDSIPRVTWAFIGVGYCLWHLAKSVDRLTGELHRVRERVSELEMLNR